MQKICSKLFFCDDKENVCFLRKQYQDDDVLKEIFNFAKLLHVSTGLTVHKQGQFKVQFLLDL